MSIFRINLSFWLFIGFLACCGSAQSQSIEQIDKEISLADQLLKEAEYKLALEAYNEILADIDETIYFKQIIICKNEIGNILIIQSNFNKGIALLKENLVFGIDKLDEQNLIVATTYQYLGLGLMRLGKLDEALQSHQKSLKIKLSIEAGPISIANSYLQIGHTYLYKNDESPALEYLTKALKEAKSIPKEDVVLAKIYRHLGNYNYGLMDYKQSLKYNLMAVKVLKKTCSPKDKLFATNYRNISELYNILGKLDEAQDYSEKALQVSVLTGAKLSIALSMCNLGLILKKQNDLHKAIPKFNKALDYLYEVFPSKDHVRIANTHQYLGDVYVKLGNSKDALYHFEKALKIRERDYLIGNGNYLFLIELYNGMGKVYEQQGQLRESLDFFNRALRIGINKSEKISESPLFLVSIYNNIAGVQIQQNNHLEAISNLNRSIEINTSKKGEHFNRLQLLDSYVLKLKTSYALWALSNNNDYLKKCTQLLDETLDLIYDIRVSYKDDLDRIHFNRQSHAFFALGIDVLFQFYIKTEYREYIKEAFVLMEKSRANALNQGIKENKALHFATIPDSIINQEQDSKQEIATLEQQLFHQYSNAESKKINKISNKLFTLKEKRRSLIKTLEVQYPKYYRLKYEPFHYGINDLQKNLSPSEVVVNYQVTQKSIYYISITAENFNFHKVDKPSNWEKMLSSFRAIVANKDQINNEIQYERDIDSFISLSSSFYDLLLKAIFEKNAYNYSEIRIIPDGELCFLSFELLLTKNPTEKSYKALPYLLREYSVGYSYSARVLINKESSKIPQHKKIYGGFAPSYNFENGTQDSLSFQTLSYSNLMDLPAIRKEVQANAKSFSGDYYIYRNATKQAFIDNAHKYQILHLGMHAVINNENPLRSTFVFERDESNTYEHLLDIGDIYNMNISSDLAILSACNTGFGKLYKGEGPLSLSRAFNYAGCSNLITSLWQVPDIQTAEITSSFLKELKTGKQKEESLRLAKLNYLKDSPSSMSHPIYWAGFISSGSNEDITIKTGGNSGYILLSVGLFLISLVVFKKLKVFKLKH